MKKTLEIIKKVLVAAVVVLAVSVMLFTIISVNTLDRNDRNLFGYKFFIVLSDSMSATDFSAGDVVVIKEVDPSTLQAGDIIAFESTNTESFGEVVTHKIRSLTTDMNGEPGFITYGTTTDTDDEEVVTYLYVLGKYQMHLPGVGRVFQFLKTVPGYFICIFLPFILLILNQGVNTVMLFRRYKREQLEAIEEERAAQQAAIEEERAAQQAAIEEERAAQQAAIEEERAVQQAAIEEERQKLDEQRAEQQRMMEELMELRKQVEQLKKE